ncbi:MAG: outer membrane protein assembly factor BamC [Porticoccaceae bacterium]|nr:outer membrane protein assembly factor BamC [Porticoccaceae bacterium]MDG1474217.1 outer membrane protein assembly factor BamC [Porticoccaceae bacterium]
MKILSYVILTTIFINLTGCGWLGLRDRTQDYLLAEATEPTVVPIELESSQLGQLYPLPAIEHSTEQLSSFDVPRPQPASVNTFEKLVKIQSFDERRWILINMSPSELWPRLRNVLNRNGIPSARAEGSTGLIETVWVTFSSDEDNAHRFLFKIAPGVQFDSTEITVIHNQISKGQQDGALWGDTSDNDQRELDMLTLVANDLAGAENFASVSLLAQDIGGASKVDVVSSEAADPFIDIKLNFDRTWASVLYSAERGGFSIIDKDRSKGILFVKFSEPTDDSDGFFSKLFSRGGDDEVVVANYRILVTTNAGSVEVRVVDLDDNSIVRAKALRLLTILRSNLS